MKNMSTDNTSPLNQDVNTDNRSDDIIHIGCVSYLNAKPLVHGIEDLPGLTVRFDVPSRLLADLEAGRTDIALCPIIDYHRSGIDLEIVPVGAIGCLGQTLTVKLLSKIPFDRVNRVHVDTHSHTSVMLMRLIMAMRYGRQPIVEDYCVSESCYEKDDEPQCLLIIGDKVVWATTNPTTEAWQTDRALSEPRGVVESRYPHQLDLGQAWHDLTGLGFVFAAWMTRVGSELGDIPGNMQVTRQRNAKSIDVIASIYGPRHGWPVELAKHYLRDLMRYDLGPSQLETIQYFSRLVKEYGLLKRLKPILVRQLPQTQGIAVGPFKTKANVSKT